MGLDVRRGGGGPARGSAVAASDALALVRGDRAGARDRRSPSASTPGGGEPTRWRSRRSRRPASFGHPDRLRRSSPRPKTRSAAIARWPRGSQRLVPAGVRTSCSSTRSTKDSGSTRAGFDLAPVPGSHPRYNTAFDLAHSYLSERRPSETLADLEAKRQARDKQALIDWLDRSDPRTSYLLIRGQPLRSIRRRSGRPRHPGLPRDGDETQRAGPAPGRPASRPRRHRRRLRRRDADRRRRSIAGIEVDRRSERRHGYLAGRRGRYRPRQILAISEAAWCKKWDYASCAVISFCANSLFCPTAMTVRFVAIKC